MKKVTVLAIKDYIYDLIDEEGNKYSLNLEFINIDEQPSTGDILYLDERMILDKEVYTFGPINNKYGKEIESENNTDIVILDKKEKRIYLQRYYG